MKKIMLKKNKTTKKIASVIKPGTVLYVNYLLLKEDEVRVSNFIGLCISKKNKSGALILKNYIKKESMKLLIYYNSPLTIKLTPIKRYRKKYRLSKLYYKM